MNFPSDLVWFIAGLVTGYCSFHLAFSAGWRSVRGLPPALDPTRFFRRPNRVIDRAQDSFDAFFDSETENRESRRTDGRRRLI